MQKIIELHPSFIFSGHDHESFHFVGTKKNAQAEEFRVLRENRKISDFETSDDTLHEVTVPTCSYRMGKQTYGYGAAVVGKDINFTC